MGNDNIVHVPFRAIGECTASERGTIAGGHCPDCGHRGFVLGPRKGSAINLECGACTKRFNVVQFAVGEIVFAERIPNDTKWRGSQS